MASLSLQEALQQFLKTSRLKNGIQAVQLEELWEELMGVTIAKYTDSIKIIGQTLFIQSSVAPLKNELMYQKDTIIERVNEAFGDQVIKDVVVR
jgi:hypothetical protein